MPSLVVVNREDILSWESTKRKKGGRRRARKAKCFVAREVFLEIQGLFLV